MSFLYYSRFLSFRPCLWSRLILSLLSFFLILLFTRCFSSFLSTFFSTLRLFEFYVFFWERVTLQLSNSISLLSLHFASHLFYFHPFTLCPSFPSPLLHFLSSLLCSHVHISSLLHPFFSLPSFPVLISIFCLFPAFPSPLSFPSLLSSSFSSSIPRLQ